jgi:LuxR family maltose regulon positive regulatory protein
VLTRLCSEVRARIQATAGDRPPGAALTTAEVRVLQYLPTHLTFPEIAAQLFVSRHTVKTQALSAYRKLGAHTRSEAITNARAVGLLPPA